MFDLNLRALGELHLVRRMWMRGRHREDLCGHCRMVYPCPTRQLLDLVGRLGVELETMVRIHPRDGCVGTECLCNRAADILDDYRQAKVGRRE